MPTPTSVVPWFYTLFFLYIEPVATAVGAYYAHLDQSAYMTLTMEMARPATAGLLGVSMQESIVLTQLANMYFVFALNEALVLRATTDRRVWSIFLFGLLVADFGHLYSVKAVGWDVYYRFWAWNSIYWGNLGFVYIGATMRTAFLLGLGLPSTPTSRDKLKP